MIKKIKAMMIELDEERWMTQYKIREILTVIDLYQIQ